jgi:hypothetical protein
MNTRHWTLSWARWSNSSTSHPLLYDPFEYYPLVFLLVGLHQFMHAFHNVFIRPTFMTQPAHPLWFHHTQMQKTNYEALHCTFSEILCCSLFLTNTHSLYHSVLKNMQYPCMSFLRSRSPYKTSKILILFKGYDTCLITSPTQLSTGRPCFINEAL